MKPRATFGFYLAGCFSAWFGVMMLIASASMNPSPGGARHSALARGATALLAALSGVVTEALWRARPWAWRASVALALVYVAAVLAVFGGGQPGGVATALGLLAASCPVVAPLLIYIRGHSRTLWPPAKQPGPARVAVPPPSAARQGAPRPGPRP
jgi:hypothetical protein